MKKQICVVFITTFMLSACSCTKTTEETTVSSTEQSTEQIIETTTEETTTSTTVQTSFELEFVTSLPYMRTVDFDGEIIPDGSYLIGITSIDSDGLGLTTRYLRGFPYLLDGDVSLLQEGDSVVFNDKSMTVKRFNKANYMHVEFNEGIAGLSRGYTGQWYLGGDNDTWYDYDLADEVHIKIAEDVIIVDGYCPFYTDEETHLSYISNRNGNKNNSHVHFYQDLNELMQVCYMSSEYSDMFYGGIFITVKDQTITEMVIDPACHQPWRQNGVKLPNGYEIVLGSALNPVIEILGDDFEFFESAKGDTVERTYKYKDYSISTYFVNGIEYIREVELFD